MGRMGGRAAGWLLGRTFLAGGARGGTIWLGLIKHEKG